jgi:hypothetical protein
VDVAGEQRNLDPVPADDRELADELTAMTDEQLEFLNQAGTGADAALSPEQQLDRRAMFVQRVALALLRVAVAEGGAGASGARELAMLEDRVAVNEGRPQTYGTQIAEVADGKPVPWPCTEPERLDELRAGVGLEPLAGQPAQPT